MFVLLAALPIVLFAPEAEPNELAPAAPARATSPPDCVSEPTIVVAPLILWIPLNVVVPLTILVLDAVPILFADPAFVPRLLVVALILFVGPNRLFVLVEVIVLLRPLMFTVLLPEAPIVIAPPAVCAVP